MPILCYSGTVNLNYGEISGSACIPCSPGYYCPDTLTRTVCPGGTICPYNSSFISNLTNVGYYSLN